MNKYLEEYNKKNPLVKATMIRDGSVTLRQRIDILSENGIMGFFLVLFALGLFLNPRIAFWVASSIPVAFAGLFMLAPLLGISINAISLFGMIIVVGILVDDGIVISENIYAYYEKGKSKYEAAVQGTLDVLPSVASSVLTTVAAFGTFFFLDGRLGDFFFDMAVVVTVTLLVSMVEGALVLPSHLAHGRALEKNEENTNPGLFDRASTTFLNMMDRFLGFIRDRIYAPALRFSLDGFQKMLPMSIVVGLLFLVVMGIAGGHIRTTFFPFIERDDIQVSLQMPSGTPEKATADWLLHIEKTAWEINDEIKAKRADGQDIILKIERLMGPTTYQGRLNITLLDGEKRQMSVLEIGNKIRERSGEIVGAENVTYGSASPFGKPISISILGNNLVELKGAIEALKAELRLIEGLRDVVDNNQEGLREVNIQLTDKARQLGLNLQEIVAQVRQGFFGSEVQRLQRGRDEVRVWVRYDLQDRNNVGQLENMRIRFADGREFPLNEIATFSTKRGVVSINHIDGKREVKVEADIANRKVSVTDITTKVRTEILPKIKAQFGSIDFSFEGQSKENEKTMRSMAKVLPIVGLIMFAIILLTFRSWSQTIIVVSMIPFGFIGVGWGHWLMDAQISFFSVLGMVALVGVMVNDSIVLVATMNDKIKEGIPFDEAVYTAGLSRFRAIWLTSLTTILGLGPLILETSFQAQFLVPMAISVAFGLFIATLLSLLILPVILKLVNRYRLYTTWLWTGELLEPTMVEPANENRVTYKYIWWFPVIVLAFLVGGPLVGLGTFLCIAMFA